MFILVYNYIISVDDILYKINNEQRKHDIFRGLSINLPFVRCCPLHNKSVGANTVRPSKKETHGRIPFSNQKILPTASVGDDALGVPIFLTH